eukprot:PhM_4_TR18095/c0_g1_i2/m.49148
MIQALRQECGMLDTILHRCSLRVACDLILGSDDDGGGSHHDVNVGGMMSSPTAQQQHSRNMRTNKHFTFPGIVSLGVCDKQPEKKDKPFSTRLDFDINVKDCAFDVTGRRFSKLYGVAVHLLAHPLETSLLDSPVVIADIKVERGGRLAPTPEGQIEAWNIATNNEATTTTRTKNVVGFCDKVDLDRTISSSVVGAVVSIDFGDTNYLKLENNGVTAATTLYPVVVASAFDENEIASEDMTVMSPLTSPRMGKSNTTIMMMGSSYRQILRRSPKTVMIPCSPIHLSLKHLVVPISHVRDNDGEEFKLFQSTFIRKDIDLHHGKYIPRSTQSFDKISATLISNGFCCEFIGGDEENGHNFGALVAPDIVLIIQSDTDNEELDIFCTNMGTLTCVDEWLDEMSNEK